MDENKYLFYIVAIVAIVAIVGMIILGSNFNSTGVKYSVDNGNSELVDDVGSDLAGQAYIWAPDSECWYKSPTGRTAQEACSSKLATGCPEKPGWTLDNRCRRMGQNAGGGAGDANRGGNNGGAGGGNNGGTPNPNKCHMLCYSSRLGSPNMIEYTQEFEANIRSLSDIDFEYRNRNDIDDNTLATCIVNVYPYFNADQTRRFNNQVTEFQNNLNAQLFGRSYDDLRAEYDGGFNGNVYVLYDRFFRNDMSPEIFLRILANGNQNDEASRYDFSKLTHQMALSMASSILGSDPEFSNALKDSPNANCIQQAY